ncbi:MAG: hypothetical protein ACK55I_27660, partial [bacterium]
MTWCSKIGLERVHPGAAFRSDTTGQFPGGRHRGLSDRLGGSDGRRLRKRIDSASTVFRPIPPA